MAKLWICILLAGVCLVNIANGFDFDDSQPQMQNPPLLNFGTKLAGDDEIKNFDSLADIELKFNISYFGSSYNYIYISSDGIISFVPKVRYLDGITWSEGVRNHGADRPFIAPFYHEGYNPISLGAGEYQGKIHYRVVYADDLKEDDANDDTHYSDKKQMLSYFSQYVQEAVINPPKDFKAEMIAVVTWEDVTDKASQKDPNCDGTLNKKCKSATFQAVIISDKTNTFVMFNYLKMDIPYQNTYQAGFNGGYERGWYNVIPCHGACALALNTSRVNDLSNLVGSDLKGRYFLNVGGEEIVRGGCLPTPLKAGMMEVYPKEVGMFGGEKLEVSGKCLKTTSQIYCKFGNDQFITEGVMTNDMKGYCSVPLLTTNGPLIVSWSSDGKDWSADKEILVMHPQRVKESVEKNKENSVDWYKRDSSSITVNWPSDKMSMNPSARVEVKLIGYRETENQVEFKPLENFGETENSAGGYTFETEDYACTKDCEDYEMGLLEVALVKHYNGDAAERVAIRFGPIPLGWYVNKKLTDKTGSDWSDKMCSSWYHEDKQHADWLDELPKCPCNLDQVLADFGRWQSEGGCNLFAGSKCTYHKGAKHCVRSVSPTSSGAGNQCCYREDGTLIYSQLSYFGSTPDRSHPWGSSPYNAPNRVPSLSHWRHDVVPFYYCCLWNDYDKCDLYTKLRPTTQCDLYQVPGLALVRGDPHITTFDGLTYNFGGIGDYWLLKRQDINIQGRFEDRRGSWDLGKLRKTDKSSWKPTALTHLIISGNSLPVELHSAPENNLKNHGLNVRVGKKRHFFLKDSTKWQDFQGQIIINNAVTMKNNRHNNFTIITSNVGINVVGVNNLLHVTVSLPPSLKFKGSGLMGMGLLGMFDGNRNNDYVSKSNTQSSPGLDPKKLYMNFAKSWAVEKKDSLFPLEKDASQFREYMPYFSYDEIPHDFTKAPTDSQISSTCDKDEYCKWDYRITGSRDVAMATKEADKLFDYSQGSAYLIESCGLLPVGKMAVMNSYNFSTGRDITVTGCEGGLSFDGQAEFSCVKERLDIAKDKNRDDYGRHIVDNHVKYIIHWVPKPYQICGESTEGASIATIIGIVAAVIIVIVILVIVVLVLMRRNKRSKQIQKPVPKDRARKDDRFEEDAEEPMFSKSKNPVYKGGQDKRGSSVV